VRAGITTVLLPKQNEPDLEDLPEDVRRDLQVLGVEELGEALALTLRGASMREGRLHFAESATAAARRPKAPEVHH
jgi:ATP-dependent Lon protease